MSRIAPPLMARAETPRRGLLAWSRLEGHRTGFDPRVPKNGSRQPAAPHAGVTPPDDRARRHDQQRGAGHRQPLEVVADEISDEAGARPLSRG
jgi:hypothetical protein